MNLEEIKKRKDIRSRKVIFVPFCSMCQAFQAKYIVNKYPAVIKPVIQELVDYDVNLIQMPCPESQLGGYNIGLNRDPKGYNQYNTPEFRHLCSKLVDHVIEMIEGLLVNKFEIVAILGIEYSPSCAVNYQYGGVQGTIHQQGIFIEMLKKQLSEKNISIPFIGINRRGVGKAIEKLRELLNPQETFF